MICSDERLPTSIKVVSGVITVDPAGADNMTSGKFLSEDLSTVFSSVIVTSLASDAFWIVPSERYTSSLASISELISNSPYMFERTNGSTYSSKPEIFPDPSLRATLYLFSKPSLLKSKNMTAFSSGPFIALPTTTKPFGLLSLNMNSFTCSEVAVLKLSMRSLFSDRFSVEAFKLVTE